MAAPVRILLVANPKSGHYRGRRWLRAASRWLAGREVQVREAETVRRGDAEEQGRGDLSGFDGVAAIGGDGTLNELVQGLGGTGVPLAILPAGTGNVVARELSVPGALGRALPLLLDGAVRTMDLGRVNGRRFLFVVSAGFDAAVVHEVAGRPSRLGFLRYLPATWRARRRAEVPFEVQVPGRPPVRVHWAAVLNTSRYAGPFRVCPAARVDDGWLDLLVLREPVRPRLAAVLWALARGRVAALPDAGHQRVAAVTLRGAPWAELDGDPFPAGDLHVEVEPGVLRVRTPRGPLPAFVRPEPDGTAGGALSSGTGPAPG